MVDGYLNGWVDPEKVRSSLVDAFKSMWPDRETWGTDTAADPQAAAMMEAARAQELTPEQREEQRRERDRRRAAAAPPTGD